MEVFLKGSTSSTKFKEKEFEKVLSLDENSRIVKQICQLNEDFVKNRRNESQNRVSALTKEVLKACNVIRPSVKDLTLLPQMRRQAHDYLKAERSRSNDKVRTENRL